MLFMVVSPFSNWEAGGFPLYPSWQISWQIYVGFSSPSVSSGERRT